MHFKTSFYHSVVFIFLMNVLVGICTIQLYSHLISHFIHNWFELAIKVNAFNGKSCIVVISNYYIQIPVALFLLLYWKVVIILETVCISQFLWTTRINWWTWCPCTVSTCDYFQSVLLVFKLKNYIQFFTLCCCFYPRVTTSGPNIFSAFSISSIVAS